MLALDSDVCPAPRPSHTPRSSAEHLHVSETPGRGRRRPSEAGRSHNGRRDGSLPTMAAHGESHGELQHSRRPHQNPNAKSARTIDRCADGRSPDPGRSGEPPLRRLPANLANASTTKQSLCPFSVCKAVFFCGTKATWSRIRPILYSPNCVLVHVHVHVCRVL